MMPISTVELACEPNAVSGFNRSRPPPPAAADIPRKERRPSASTALIDIVSFRVIGEHDNPGAPETGDFADHGRALDLIVSLVMILEFMLHRMAPGFSYSFEQ
jgi:hypothetical protein